MLKRILKNSAALIFGLVIAFFILEAFLRIFNPFPQRIKGGKIILPINQHYTIKNSSFSKLDKEIIHTKNSLGFRGEEIPDNFSDYLSIIVIGGSTSECFYLSDNKTWPYLLEQTLKNLFFNVWVNNAGLDGHSTFGHQILLDDYVSKIKPKFIIYLVGMNDIERSDLNYGFDNKIIADSFTNWKDYLAKKSEVINLAMNLIRVEMAKKKGLVSAEIDFSKIESLTISDDQIKNKLESENNYLAGYKLRLEKLVESTKAYGIEPILITQPMLWGKGSDPRTGINLETAKVAQGKNGKLYWSIMELYNEITKKVGAEKDVFAVDLAEKMPKDSLYFYDGIHFTSEGSAKVFEIISNDLMPYLQNKYK